ncbi:hypothetical protein [Phenylobacterium sp.]|jgi:hypothetical protein|uniref:hypothetical protein n=1 Tax=Phenylobacterium sp. TaxID=1871053 RepID=UPI002F9260F1
MDIDLPAFRRELESEMDRYVEDYEPPEGTFGTPWNREKVAAEVAEMRRCLIEPYWIDVDIQDPPHDHFGPQRSYACVAVAEDPGSYLLVFMPHRDAFLLLSRTEDRWQSLGVDGDAVGTFLAR